MTSRANVGNLHSGLKVIVQRRAPGGAIRCRGYVEVPSALPALILIVAAPSKAAEGYADELERALDLTIHSLGSHVAPGPVPCNGWVSGELSCHGHKVDACRKLLVLVTDTATGVPAEPLFGQWHAGGDSYAVLPLVPQGADAWRLLPPGLQALNVAHWTHSPAECVDEILGLSGVGTEDRRVFVSYRRREAQELAEQLFEELTKRGFDVFVDRFRVPLGRDFQERLIDELADKAMVLVLESPTILQSRWTALELAFAKEHDLGRFAIHVPGGAKVPWLEDEFRVTVTSGDLVPASPIVTDTSRLTVEAMERVIQRLIAEHTRAYLRRRGLLIDTLRAALTQHGATDQLLDASGHLHVRVVAGGNQREYVLWASPRPPRVGDFRTAHRVCKPGPDPAGVMVTTALFRETRRRQESDWLADVSLVRLTDQGRINELTAAIADGEDLP